MWEAASVRGRGCHQVDGDGKLRILLEREKPALLEFPIRHLLVSRLGEDVGELVDGLDAELSDAWTLSDLGDLETLTEP